MLVYKNVNAQPATLWTKTFGGSGADRAYSVQQTLDGGYIITGSIPAPGYLIKTDANGNIQWTNTYEGSGKFNGHSVQQTLDGGYIVGGTLYSGMPQLRLVKTNVNGVEQWSRLYGDLLHDFGRSVQQTQDGGYIFGGSKTSITNNDLDFYLLKTNSSGEPQWEKTYGGDNEDSGFSVEQTQDGGYIFVGDTYSYGAGSGDVYLIKTDSNGNETWSKTYGGTSADAGKSVRQTEDGGYIITGTYESGQGYSKELYLIKTDEYGDTLWTRTYGGTGRDAGNCVQQTHDGGYIVVGDIYSIASASLDIWLVRTDSSGDTLWTRTFGQDWGDYGYSVQQTTDLGYIVAGYLEYGIGDGDAWLIRVAPDISEPCNLGDVNDDGLITPGDALCAFQVYLSGGTPPPDCDNPCALEAADVSCTLNGVTPGDALYIFRAYLDGKTPPLECNPEQK
jgi:hypothetical protein